MEQTGISVTYSNIPVHQDSDQEVDRALVSISRGYASAETQVRSGPSSSASDTVRPAQPRSTVLHFAVLCVQRNAILACALGSEAS